jgi:beta-glucanase (GH16 family)
MMYKLCALTALLGYTAQVALAAEKLIFEDNFDRINFDVWQHEITLGGGGNWEFEYYTNNRSNSYTKDSILYLKPTLTADRIGEQYVETGYTMDLWGSTPADSCTSNSFYGCLRSSGAGGNYLNPIQSARLRTVNSFTFTYGRVEIRAKLPKGDWLWPAIWMLPSQNVYGQWPASGEIDIVESRGNANYKSGGGVESFASTLHWGPFYGQDAYPKTTQKYSLTGGKTFNDDFHTFGLIWTNTSIQTYVDDPTNVVLNVDLSNSTLWEQGGWDKTKLDNPWRGGPQNAPFDQKFYLIMNVACGGTTGYWDDSEPAKPWNNKDDHAINSFWNNRGAWYPTWEGENAALQVDYIKVWQTVEDESVM